MNVVNVCERRALVASSQNTSALFGGASPTFAAGRQLAIYEVARAGTIALVVADQGAIFLTSMVESIVGIVASAYGGRAIFVVGGGVTMLVNAE